jgi:hypothetical protein
VVLIKWQLIKSTYAVQSLLTNLYFIYEMARALDCLVLLRTCKVALVSGCLQPYYFNNQSVRSRNNTNIIQDNVQFNKIHSIVFRYSMSCSFGSGSSVFQFAKIQRLRYTEL